MANLDSALRRLAAVADTQSRMAEQLKLKPIDAHDMLGLHFRDGDEVEDQVTHQKGVVLGSYHKRGPVANA